MSAGARVVPRRTLCPRKKGYRTPSPPKRKLAQPSRAERKRRYLEALLRISASRSARSPRPRNPSWHSGLKRSLLRARRRCYGPRLITRCMSPSTVNRDDSIAPNTFGVVNCTEERSPCPRCDHSSALQLGSYRKCG